MTTLIRQIAHPIVKRVSVKYNIYIIGFILTIVTIHTLTLLIIPAPFTDDAWYASRAWYYLRTGLVFGPLDDGITRNFEGYWTFFPKLPTLIHAIGARLFPANLLLAVRSASLFFGFSLLVVMYIIGNSLGGRRLGLLCSLLTSLSWPFFISAHLGRTDIIVACLGFAAIALHLINKGKKIWVGFLSGLSIGLAFEIHPFSAIYVPVILSLFLLESRLQVLKRLDFWALNFGFIVGLLLYVFLHILPYPDTFFALNNLLFMNTHVPPILSLNLNVIMNSIKDMGFLLFFSYPLLLIFLYAIVRVYQSRLDKFTIILTISLVLIISFTLLIRNKLIYYSILFSPALDITVASFLLVFLDRPKKSIAEFRIRGAIIGLIIISSIILPIKYRITQGNWNHFPWVQGEINQIVRQGDSVMANQLYWLGLYNHEFYSWHELAYYQRKYPGSSIEEAFEVYKPDLFLIDYHIDSLTSDDDNNSLYSQYFGVPKSELNEYLEENANLVKVIEDIVYGPIRIYRFNWGR